MFPFLTNLQVRGSRAFSMKFQFSRVHSDLTTHPQCRMGKEKTNMAYRDEIDDAFDAVVFLEERYSFTFTLLFN